MDQLVVMYAHTEKREKEEIQKRDTKERDREIQKERDTQTETRDRLGILALCVSSIPCYPNYSCGVCFPGIVDFVHFQCIGLPLRDRPERKRRTPCSLRNKSPCIYGRASHSLGRCVPNWTEAERWRCNMHYSCKVHNMEVENMEMRETQKHGEMLYIIYEHPMVSLFILFFGM